MSRQFQQRFRWDERPTSDLPGIYAYYINRTDELRPVAVTEDGPLYIGMTNSSLDARCHFEHQHSGFSTFRRSLGAILKDRLQLRALPRASGPSRTNVLCFRFDTEGESRLTNWMRAHLSYAYCEIADHIARAEKEAIKCAFPPLNLMGWKNDQRSEIKRMRAACVAEALAGVS